MADIPDNGKLEWLARHLIDFRDEMRRFALAARQR